MGVLERTIGTRHVLATYLPSP